MAYSDLLLMLKDGTIEKIGTPKDVFNALNTDYQAGFFGEITKIPASLFTDSKIDTEIVLLPHQLLVSKEKTKLAVKIVAHYFKGSLYLIHGKWKHADVFFEHPNAAMKIGAKVYLKKLP